MANDCHFPDCAPLTLPPLPVCLERSHLALELSIRVPDIAFWQKNVRIFPMGFFWFFHLQHFHIFTFSHFHVGTKHVLSLHVECWVHW